MGEVPSLEGFQARPNRESRLKGQNMKSALILVALCAFVMGCSSMLERRM